MKINKSLQNIVQTIVESIHPQRIILFGSRARGDGHSLSDYDLLVIKRGVKNERNFSRKIHNAFYENKINQSIDVIVVDAAKFDKQKNNPYLIYAWALKEGKQLYG